MNLQVGSKYSQNYPRSSAFHQNGEGCTQNTLLLGAKELVAGKKLLAKGMPW
jgi:hypothetical protein